MFILIFLRGFVSGLSLSLILGIMKEKLCSQNKKLRKSTNKDRKPK